MQIWLDRTLPCCSVRSVAWLGDWLFLGTDDGTLNTLRVTPRSSITATPTTGESNTFQRKLGEAHHIQCYSGHTAPVCYVCADAKGLVVTGDSYGYVGVWEEAGGQWQRHSYFSLEASGELVGLTCVSSADFAPQVHICALDDGRLLRGTSEGVVLWSRDVKKPCSCFCARPDGSGFALATHDGEILLYDSRGLLIQRRAPRAHDSTTERITALAWQPGSWSLQPLLVAYRSGHALLLQSAGDSQPYHIDTRLSSCVAAEWSPAGTYAALLGLPTSDVLPRIRSFSATPETTEKSIRQDSAVRTSLLQLIQASGEVVASLDLVSGEPRSLAWGFEGGMLAAAADLGLFLVSVRQDAVCCSFGDHALAIARPVIHQQLATEVSFTGEQGGCRCIRVFPGPRLLVSGERHCAVMAHATPVLPPRIFWDEESCSAWQHQLQHQEGPYRLLDENVFCEPGLQKPQQERKYDGFPVELCDIFGNTIETVVSPLGPRFAVLLSQWLVIAGSSQHLWLYRLDGKDDSKEAPLALLLDLDSLIEEPLFKKGKGEISTLSGREDCIVLGTTEGQLLRLRLSPTVPHVKLEASGLAPSGLLNLRLSAGCTAVAGSDQQGFLHILNAVVAHGPTGFGAKLCDTIEDALDYLWASDQDNMIAVLQGSRMILICTTHQEADQPYNMSLQANDKPPCGPMYLIELSNLCAKALCLSCFQQGQAAASEHDFLIRYDAEPLVQMRQLISLEQLRTDESGALVGLRRATALAARFNHPTLWKLIADAALLMEDVDAIEEALVLKQARRLGETGEGRPLLKALAGDILGAGVFYESLQKWDQAAYLFATFGMWEEASDTLRLTESSKGRGDQTVTNNVREALADAWKERRQWSRAIDLYRSLVPREGLFESYFFSEDYESLERTTSGLHEEEQQVLLRAAHLLAAIGKGSASAEAFLKAEMPELALNAALHSGEWTMAISLAREHCNNTKLQAISATYKAAVQHQQGVGGILHADETSISLGDPEAAEQGLDIFTSQLESSTWSPQRQRNMRVMAALLIRQSCSTNARTNEQYCLTYEIPSSTDRPYRATPSVALTGHFSPNLEEEKQWLGAAEYHLYLLCCLHHSERRFRAALCAAVRLWECCSQEVPRHVRAHLLFVSACKAKEWELSSQALHVLEMSSPASSRESQHLKTTSILLFAERHEGVPNYLSMVKLEEARLQAS
ncbi:wd repeat-containing protein [Cyclospora cayetanensis]|uniref:Wd repeat-containing protein n=1 Tax=Cyclospora cayetanensis TaxID=88456 RepID=A0A1D3D3Q6_9EIME|nr:wd repeat-containing protein [Cyclospora cayetanensis]